MITRSLVILSSLMLSLLCTDAMANNHSARALKDYRAAYKKARLRYGTYKESGLRYHLVKASRRGIYLVAEQTRGTRDAKVLYFHRRSNVLTEQNASERGRRVIAGSAITTGGEAQQRAQDALRMDERAGRGGQLGAPVFKGITHVKNSKGRYTKVFAFAKQSEDNQRAYVSIREGTLVKMVDSGHATYGGAASRANNR